MTAPITENVFSAENVLVDIQKMKQAERITGSQYLMKSELGRILTDTVYQPSETE